MRKLWSCVACLPRLLLTLVVLAICLIAFGYAFPFLLVVAILGAIFGACAG